MIIEEMMYACGCDRCEKVFEGHDYSFWADKRFAIEQATDDDWIEIEDKQYCPDCYEWNEDGSDYVIKPILSNKL